MVHLAHPTTHVVIGGSKTGLAYAEKRKKWAASSLNKPCKKCGATDRYPTGLCKPCNSNRYHVGMANDPHYNTKRQVKRYYGITANDKEEMYSAQCGLCAFCKNPLPDVWARGCHVDHDHSDGRIRGLVHARCNHIIGVLDTLRLDPLFRSNAEEYFR